MLPEPDKINAVTKFIRALTLEGILLTFLLLFGILVLYAMYQYIPEWAPLLWKSEWARIVLFVVLGAGALWASVSGLYKRTTSRLDAVQLMLQAQTKEIIEDLEVRVSAADREREGLREELHTALVRIAELTVQEQECRARVEALKVDFERLRRSSTRPHSAPGLEDG